MDELRKGVAAAYQRCGFDADASISTLQMLTNIEIRLEEYLAAAEQLPTADVEAEEKARQKERRHAARCAGLGLGLGKRISTLLTPAQNGHTVFMTQGSCAAIS